MKKNTHLEHPEDLLLQQGLDGVKNILHYFRSIIEILYGDKNNTIITIKYDGAPSVVFGRHPKNFELFVSTKSFFNKKPLYAHNAEEIVRLFMKGPHKVLTALLSTLESAEVAHVGVFQGDILYTPETLIQTETHYLIKHNTLTYHVDKTSVLGEQIARNAIGLVVHTEYAHINENEYDTSFTPQFEQSLAGLLNPYIWHPPLQSFLPVKIKHYNAITNIVDAIDALSMKSNNLKDMHQLIKDVFTNPKTWFDTLQKIINKSIREEKTLPDADKLWNLWKQGMTQSYMSKKGFKAEDDNNPCKVIEMFETTHYNDVIAWLQWYIDTASCKDTLVSLLHSLVNIPGLEVYIDDVLSTHEGFVVSNGKEQWVIKLVKRSEFSHANFTLEKPWEK